MATGNALSEAATEAADRYLKAAEKFDYFMAGAAGALCAYVAQHYEPTRLGINPSTLELVSLLILVASAVAAFKRLEEHTVVADTAAQLAMYANVAVSGDDQKISRAEAIIGTASAGTKQRRAARRAELAYAWRNRLMLAGFLTLLAARVWGPYYRS